MSANIGLIASGLVLFLSVSTITALIFRLVFPTVLNQMGRLAPPERANALWVLAALPSLLGIMAVFIVLLPSITHALGITADHCIAHGHHRHLCLVHSPLWSGTAIEAAILGLAVLVAVSRLTAIMVPFIRSQLALSALLSLTGQTGARSGCQLLSSRRVFAFTAGLFRPRIYVSSRLAEELDDDEYQAVILHENGHKLRRDGLRKLSAQVLSEAHFPVARRALLIELALAIEQSCDEYAARAMADRLTVAEAIVRLSRMAGLPQIHEDACQAFNASSCEQRVTGMLNPPIPRRRFLSMLGFASFLAASTGGLVTAEFWHHGFESLLGMFSG